MRARVRVLPGRRPKPASRPAVACLPGGLRRAAARSPPSPSPYRTGAFAVADRSFSLPFLSCRVAGWQRVRSMTGPASERCLGKTEGLGKRPGGKAIRRKAKHIRQNTGAAGHGAKKPEAAFLKQPPAWRTISCPFRVRAAEMQPGPYIMELIIRISRLVQVIMFPNVCGPRRNRKTLLCAPKRRDLRSAKALARTPVAFDGPIFALRRKTSTQAAPIVTES